MLLVIYMKNNYNKLINQIQKARTKNNVNWMNILKVAIKFAPIEAKKIIKEININDKKISQLVSKLSK
jgi:predicted transcriptional regulator